MGAWFRIGLVLAGWTCAAKTARADSPAHEVNPFDEPDESELFRVEQRLVTVASRYAQTVRQAPSIVTVITDQEIRERGYRTLSDVLSQIPGIFVTVAKESRGLAWFRGVISSDNDKFLLLIDGVPWYDGVYTHAWLDPYIPIENVKQIEVIKGPGSAIYGTNAFAGVVNVVTYDATDLQGGFVRLTGGSYASRSAAAVMGEQVAGRPVPVSVTAYARTYDQDGDGLAITPSGAANVNNNNPERSINAGFGLKAGGFDFKVDLVDYRHTYFVNSQDNAFSVLLQDPNAFALHYKNAFLSARYDVSLGRTGTVTPYIYAQRHDNPSSYAWFQNPATTIDPTTGEATTEWQTTLVDAEKLSERYGAGVEAKLHPSPAHTTVAGVGAEGNYIVQLEDLYYVNLSHDADASTFHADPAWITDAFGFVQHTWTASWWTELTGGARIDDHSFFGVFVSPRAGLLLMPSEKVTGKVLYGRAFRAPTARELLVEVGTDSSGSNLFTNGNPNLKPEVIDTLEAEATGDLTDQVQLRAAVFYSTIDQEINKSTQSDAQLGDLYYTNKGGSNVVGGELEAQAKFHWLTLDGSWSYTHAVDRDTGYLQYGFPPQMGHLRGTWRVVPGLRVSLMGDFVGKQPAAAWTPDSKLGDGPAYALFSLGVVARPKGDKLSADLAIHNLGDARYSHQVYLDDANATNSDGSAKYPYGMEGERRTVQVGIEYRF